MYARWMNAATLDAKKFRCGFCDNKVSSIAGYYSERDVPDTGNRGWIYICPDCENPTYFCARMVLPRPLPGNKVSEVPEDVYQLYVEARRAVSVAAFTASVLASRKVLMNLAVSLGAEPGKSFIEYVNYLSDAGYVPPNGKGWVDHIRQKGNEATHEIPAMAEEDAVELVTFLEMLLKFVFEFPAKVPSAKPDESA